MHVCFVVMVVAVLCGNALAVNLEWDHGGYVITDVIVDSHLVHAVHQVMDSVNAFQTVTHLHATVLEIISICVCALEIISHVV